MSRGAHLTTELCVAAKLGERLSFANAEGRVGRKVLPPSSFHPSLLRRRGDPGPFGPVASAAGGNEILHAVEPPLDHG